MHPTQTNLEFSFAKNGKAPADRIGQRFEVPHARAIMMKQPTNSPNRSAQPDRTTPHPATSAEILGPAPAGPVASGQGPAQWPWHLKTLLSLRDRLADDHSALRESGAEPLEAHSMSEADSATDEFDHTLALRKLSTEQDALHEVDAALHRIMAGTYGVCEESGAPIPPERLRAVPWTRFTREVEERLEQTGVIPRPRLTDARSVRGDGRPWRAPGPPRPRRGRKA